MYTYFWDIETSKITTDQMEKMQVTFLSNVVTMCLKTGDIIESVFFRNISQTIEYFSKLNGIVWSHNLDYELSFLLRDMECNGVTTDKTSIYDTETQEICLRDKNAPLSITLDYIPNLTFRDSYALFNKSVADLGEELKLNKLEYDYKKIRLPWDNLEQHDYDYNERDNIIVAKTLWNYMVEHKYTIDDIPLTFTSQVRRDRKQFITSNFGKKSLVKFFFDRNNTYNNFNFFEDMMFTYQGGLTASILSQTNKFIDNKKTSGVVGVDMKSDYPNQMTTKKFPLFTQENTVTLYGELANKYFINGRYKHFIGVVKISNIRIKNENYILPISGSQLSKGSVIKPKLFNGKLISANEITLPITNIDLNVINMVYEYDNIEMLKIHATNKERYLRQEEISFLLSNFLTKESKKGNVKKAKLIINSMYGVKVSNPMKDNYLIKEGEIIVNKYFNNTKDGREEIYKNYLSTIPLFGGSIDIYSDGVWTTSFARFDLVKMNKFIVDSGGYVVYSDTDSCKFYCKTRKQMDKIIKDINKMNEDKINNNKSLVRFRKHKELFNLSDEEYNIISKIGIWEIEDKQPHILFITYGAKKYGYIDYKGQIKTTIAGCNKKNVPIVIFNVAINEYKSPPTLDGLIDSFKCIFRPGTTFDETASGRTTAKKEKRYREEMNNYTYNGILIDQYGGIIIEDTTYTLNMTIKDSELLGVKNEVSFLSVNKEGIIKWQIKM